MPRSVSNRVERHRLIVTEMRGEFLDGTPYSDMLQKLNQLLGPAKAIRARTFRTDLAALGWRRDRVIGREDIPHLVELIHEIITTGIYLIGYYTLSFFVSMHLFVSNLFV